MNNWCLTASDSATTAPRPPGLASRAKVTSKWAIKLNSKLVKANFNRVRTIHKSALQPCIPPESAIRHTHGALSLYVCQKTHSPEHRLSARVANPTGNKVWQ